MTHPRTSSSENGFTLLELLLVIGVTAVMFIGIVKISTGWMNNEVSTNAGQHMQRVNTAVHSYMEANWAAPLTETTDAVNGGASGWEGLRTKLEQEGLLTGGQLVSPLGSPMRITFFRTGTIARAIIFTTTPLPFERVLEAAQQTGNTGGTLAVRPDVNSAYGAYGQWRVPSTQLYPATAGAFPCVPSNTNSCFISLVSQSTGTLCGLYLYRVPAETGCLGNTMMTDLNMNNRNITNANQVNTTTTNVAGNANMNNMNVAGTTTLNGPTTISNTMTVGGTMTVSGDANFNGEVTMTGGGQLVANRIAVNTIEAERIEATKLQADEIDVSGTLGVAQDLTVNGNMTVNGTNGIYAASVNTGLVQAGNGVVSVGSVDIQNTMTVTGNMTVSGGGVFTDHMAIMRCTVIQGRTYGSC